MVTVLRPLSTSELLDRTFHLYRNHFLLFVGITAIPQLVVLCLQLAFRFKPEPVNSVSTGLAATGLWLIAIVATIFAHAATVIAVSALHLDRAASIRTAYAAARPALLRSAWIALVVIVLPMLIVLPLGIVLGFGLALVGGLAGHAGLGGVDNVTLIRLTSILMALVVLLVGLRWWLSWSLVIPVTVLEGTKLRATLRRSKELTKGRRLGILGIYVLIACLVLVVTWVIQAPVLLATGAGMFRDPTHVSTAAWVASLIGGFLSASLVGGLAEIALTLIYYDQRVRKEGFDLQLMMASLQPGAQASVATATTA